MGLLSNLKQRMKNLLLAAFKIKTSYEKCFQCWNDRLGVVSIQHRYRHKYQYPMILIFIKIFLTKNFHKYYLKALRKEFHLTLIEIIIYHK